MKKSGFVVMIGRSNVGKSTLLNAVIGSKIAITTPKPQTTRMPIQGVLTQAQGQMVFVDTPGVLKGARDVLSKKLAESVQASLTDVNVLVYVVDPSREIGDEERSVMQMIKNVEGKRVLVINKCDLSDKDKPFIDFYRDLGKDFDATMEVSALRGTHIPSLISTLFDMLPEGEAFYPEGQLTNMPNNIWLAELIREKLFLRLRQEVPYSVHVEVDEAEVRPNGMFYIRATVFTTDERYKRMMIGQGGRGIKEIGQSTRRELEQAMDTKVFLDLTVEVDAHWMQRFE